MIILGIETSCDETAAAVVEKKNHKINVLSSAIATSVEMHAESGGIIPENAAREQIKSILPTIEKSIKQSGKNVEDIDAIAVTYGPGLIGSLLVGVETAKTLSFVWKKPLIAVNHLIGHIYSCFINASPSFPAVGLVVSGGHTDFVYIKNHSQIEFIGGTRDDAAGEAFDKTARIIGLGYPGGPAISKEAKKYKGQKLDLLPRPMINSGNLDMSFSGLKTAVLNQVKNEPDFDKQEMAAQIQEAIIDTLIEKSRLAINIYQPKSFLLSGGVAANERLSEKMLNTVQTAAKTTNLYVSDIVSATDNAVMIATAAHYHKNEIDWKKLSASPGLSIDNL